MTAQISTADKTLSIIIPVYNEENTLEEILQRVQEAPIGNIKKEIVLIDDNSTDNSREIITRYAEEHPNVTSIFHEVNKGKGAALQSGFNRCIGDWILIQDADYKYDPNEYIQLLEPILEDKADVVYGSRFVSSRPRRVVYYWHSVGNKILTMLSNMCSNINLTDMETCYKLFCRDVLSQISIEENRFGFEPEITAKIAKINCRIYEVGISYYGRTYSEGKKIGWKDGVRALYCIIKYNFFSK